jgi:hypothetical protein
VRHLYVSADGFILGVQENQHGTRFFTAPEGEAHRWLDIFDAEGLPDTGPGQAITEQGLHTLIGSARPGDTGEMEAVYASGEAHDFTDDEEDTESSPVAFRLGPLGMRFLRCCDPITGFREFLRVWHFLDQDTGSVKLLGEELWPGQVEYALTVIANPWTYSISSRERRRTRRRTCSNPSRRDSGRCPRRCFSPS